MKLTPVMQVPFRIRQLRDIENFRVICQCRIAHPDPDYSVPLDHWEGWNIGALRRVVLPGHTHASSASIKRHSMIATLYRVADPLPLGEWQKPMRAAIFKRMRFARAIAKQCDACAHDL